MIEYANDYADRECRRLRHRLFPRTQIHQERSEGLPGLEESFLTFHNRFSAKTTSTPVQCSIAPSEWTSASNSDPLVNTLPRPNSAIQSSTRSAPQGPQLQPSDDSWSDRFGPVNPASTTDFARSSQLPLAVVTNTLPHSSMACSFNPDETACAPEGVSDHS